MGIHMKNSVNYTGGGMGAGATKLELTLAEYEALTPEEKNNGTMYFLTDVNGDGEQFQPITYSEDEREIGVWTDGKPLYQKSFTFSGTYSGSMAIGNINISNIDVLIISECTGHTADGTWRNISFAHMDASNNSGLFIKTNGDVEVRCGSGVSGQYAYDKIQMTIRYTKTTDSPGSGQWTPQGVPTVHYNNTEKIVGTWFGETLYEKSYYVQGVKDSAITVDSSMTGTTVKLIEIKQTFFTTGGAYANVWGNNSISSSMFLRTLLGNAGLGVNFDGYRTDYYGNDGFDVYLTVRYTKISSS